MLTKLTIRNFKLFDEVELDLGPRVVLVGPNNTGKTSALQALALWEIGVKRWLEKRGAGNATGKKRQGVTINQRDLIAVPVPTAKLLWHDLHVRKGRRENGKTRTDNVLMEVVAEGIGWNCGLEFDYAKEEFFYCRPLRQDDKNLMTVPEEAGKVRIAYLPPMSGLAANEIRLEQGTINVRLGEGRTAEVLRNLCYQIVDGEDGESKWGKIVEQIEKLFGSKLDFPEYIPERGEITLSYRTKERVRLDLSASGRGQQQTLLLLTHMVANPGSVLLLDEPDAHLEILRQRQIYQLLSETAEETNSQIIAASHSEVIMNEAADRDVLIAFIGKPHRIDDRSERKQVLKSLKEIGFEHYLLAEERGWVLYLEGSTDLAILLALARRLDHPAAELLENPYVHYVGNQPSKAQAHFHALREAKSNLVGIAIYDRLEQELPEDPYLTQLMWRQREIENYLCQRETLLAFAREENKNFDAPLFDASWRETMEESISEIEKALKTLEDASPWGPDIKASDDFLDKVFQRFYREIGSPQLTEKTDYHVLANYMKPEDIDSEIKEKLDAIVKVAKRAKVG